MRKRSNIILVSEVMDGVYYCRMCLGARSSVLSIGGLCKASSPFYHTPRQCFSREEGTRQARGFRYNNTTDKIILSKDVCGLCGSRCVPSCPYQNHISQIIEGFLSEIDNIPDYE